MKKPLRWLALAAVASLAACVLTTKGFQTVFLDFALAEDLVAGEQREVHRSFYPAAVEMKGFFVRISGKLVPAEGGDLPSQVKVAVANSDAATERVGFRFNMTVKVKPDGNFNATKRWKKNIPANTTQTVSVEPVGADIPLGSQVWLCLDAAKKKSQFGESCEMEGSDPGGQGRIHEVRVLDNRFDPQSLTILPGDTVRWVLRGSNPTHTTMEMNATWDSGFAFVEEGDFFERTFPQSEDGLTFMYSCVTHQGCCEMQGSILVGPNASPPDDGY